jgi:cell filamentation protein
MSDSYKYIDPDYTYIDPVSGLLNNLLNISDYEVLLFVESSAVSKRLQELFKNPINIKGTSSLLEIHHYLFQDIYAWAGKVRTVNISKDGKPFFDGERFSSAFQYIDSLIDEYRTIDSSNFAEIAKALASILDYVNFLHPFREGNGRTQREFIRLLALEKELTLNLNPADNTTVYNQYMQGTINGDIELLSQLIFEQINNSNLK